MPHIKTDIREEHRIAVAGIERKTGPVVDDDLVELMKPLGEKPVEVDDHGISFSGLVISRLDQDALKRNPVHAVPLHKLGTPPGKIADLGIDIRDLLRRRELPVAHPDIRIFLITFSRVHQNIRFFGFGQEPESFLLFQQLLHAGISHTA